MTTIIRNGIAVLVPALLASAAGAFPVATFFSDTPGCDVLSGPKLADELGFTPPFPVACSITATYTFTNQAACPGSDLPPVPNALVFITNLSGRTFTDLWYVGELNTGFSNIDGMVNGAHAFKIDAVGLNAPLVSESTLADGIFSPGETWEFIIDDYSNSFGLPPDAFISIGVPSGGGASTGSIIAVPAPAAVSVLLGAAGATTLRRRRR